MRTGSSRTPSPAVAWGCSRSGVRFRTGYPIAQRRFGQVQVAATCVADRPASTIFTASALNSLVKDRRARLPPFAFFIGTPGALSRYPPFPPSGARSPGRGWR
jgi:hypothetical protein